MPGARDGQGPLLESHGNFSSPKPSDQIKTWRKRAQVLANKPIYFLCSMIVLSRYPLNYWNFYLECEQQQLSVPLIIRTFRETMSPKVVMGKFFAAHRKGGFSPVGERNRNTKLGFLCFVFICIVGIGLSCAWTVYEKPSCQLSSRAFPKTSVFISYVWT